MTSSAYDGCRTMYFTPPSSKVIRIYSNDTVFPPATVLLTPNSVPPPGFVHISLIVISLSGTLISQHPVNHERSSAFGTGFWAVCAAAIKTEASTIAHKKMIDLIQP